MTITNNDDIIDSRDVIDRIAELEALGTPDDPEPGDNEFTGLDQDECNELVALRKLAEQGESYCADWTYGEVLVRDDYFEAYAQQLAEDCAGSHEEAQIIRGDGAGSHWPFTCMSIDWERAASELQNDYSEIDFDGVTYWTR